ncbi:hypothetical protein KFE25_013428 [Diacronema lutheri]|uniref:JmjC domain-containing protein n=2 Tax=Diacronema lutheri TaxID=2081491 RepID=A0A8J5XUU2_DIALT|nr:hypothetical protein KFE25_013428 [Diacronema lutheri]
MAPFARAWAHVVTFLALVARGDEGRDGRVAQLHAACAAADWERAMPLAASLATDGHAAWQADAFGASRDLYRAVLHGACGCNSTLACAPLGRREQLQVHANLASSLMLLARAPSAPARARAALLDESTYHWSVPRTLAPADESLRYFHALVKADAELARALADALPLAAAAAADGREARVRPIERVNATDLPRARFLARYALAKEPVVLTGLFDGVGARPLPDVAEIVHACADRKVRLRRSGTGTEPSGSVWAGLESAVETVTLGELYAELEHGGTADGWQLFDWALPRFCPKGASLSSVRSWLPEHLTGGEGGSANLLSSMPVEAEGGGECALGGGWPSLFVQPAGTRCGAHVDGYGTHFWQLVLTGKKQWRVARAQDAPFFEAVPPRLRTLRVASLFALDYAAHPQLRLLELRETELRAGEILFVPAGCPHQVLNGAAGARGGLVSALSANFVDGSNAREAERELWFGAELGRRADVACAHAHVRSERDAAEADVAHGVAADIAALPHGSGRCAAADAPDGDGPANVPVGRAAASALGAPRAQPAASAFTVSK